MAHERVAGRSGATRSTATRSTAGRLAARRVIPGRILGPQLLLLIVTAALLLFGLVMVLSASSVVALAETGDSFSLFKRQLILVALGLVGLVVAALIPYRVWTSWLSWGVWGILILFLVLTLLFGNEESGGKRWFDLFGLNFQPSEFAKIACMLVATSLIVRLHESRAYSPFIAQAALAVGLPALLIMMQPDLGTLIIVIVGILAVAWFGELPRRAVLIGLALIIGVGLAGILAETFRQARLASFLDPWADPLGSGYQIINSYYAFADGGLFGTGLGMSRQKFLYLPMAQNDFIFAVIGEELGLIGALFVVALFVAFVLIAFRIGRNAPDLFGRVLACSCATLIGAQAFLNIFCVTGLAPITGKPLPFISAGGTSIIATLILVGLILSVSRHSNVPSSAELRRDELRILEGGARNTAGGEGRLPTPSSRPLTLLKSAASSSSKSPPKSAVSAKHPCAPGSLRSRTFATGRPAAPSAVPRATPSSFRRPRDNPALRLSPARNQRRLREGLR
ncbi:MAG: putative lipid II flippase FtsW [Coriobacteriales bacterium]|jgi:cell division protein FtsW|nr:putative lipid II flippase FtsW [Coriobacteriales bacterium]